MAVHGGGWCGQPLWMWESTGKNIQGKRGEQISHSSLGFHSLERGEVNSTRGPREVQVGSNGVRMSDDHGNSAGILVAEIDSSVTYGSSVLGIPLHIRRLEYLRDFEATNNIFLDG
ncbi:hypothetical protein MUK42_34394 [Musa troglodytarum]|uniref:Uncharacterized protein n=1 Tax=Musa troglodytarum TaxID=320322 RepID=A0A9E7JBG7_9LILI|nr:hypothetical protein MUK42_34394 [Musa troglodytarum]